MKSIGSDLPGQGGVLAFAGRHRRVLHPMTGARTSVRAPRRDCPVQSLASSLAACRMLKADRARSFLLIRPQTYAARREQGRVNVCIAAFREGFAHGIGRVPICEVFPLSYSLVTSASLHGAEAGCPFTGERAADSSSISRCFFPFRSRKATIPLG
jgi:hypothetical protein